MNFTRESIFVGAIRSLCTSLATMLGIAIGIGLIVMGLAFIIGPQYIPPKSEPVIMPDAEGDRALLSGHSPAILRIDLRGVIGVGDLTSDKIENVLLDSREDFLQGNRVKAVLLYINTPGGASDDCANIFMALSNYKTKYNVPIYAYVDGMCASAGMYIACVADKIYASPSSVIGSVGVRLGPVFNFSGAMEKVGVSSLTLTQGKDKDALNPFRPWGPNEDEDLKAIMAVLYDRFLTVVTTARPKLDKEKLINDYGAYIFIAKHAAELGYIDDGDMDYSRSLSSLVAAAQIPEHEKYQVVQLIPSHPFLNSLSQSISPHKLLQSLGFSSPTNNPELNGKVLYLYQP
ncbi:MAG TPA: S49 family peptidase [Rhabdochlamydiaceae bacterium]